METLHEEVIQRIVQFIAGEWPNARRIAALATLSAKWQRAVERRTFEHIRITNHDDDLETLERVVITDPRRRAYLRFLHFSVNLDLPATSTDSRSGSQEMQANVRFTEGLAKLFGALVLANRVDDGTAGPSNADDRSKGITLQIVPLLSRVETKKKQKNLRQCVRILDDVDTSTSTAQHQALSPVTCISHLVLGLSMERGRLAMRTALDLAKWLPGLSQLDMTAILEVPSDAQPNLAQHVDDRQELARALKRAASSPSSLREALFSIEEQDPWSVQMHPRFVFPDLTRTASDATVGPADQGAELKADPLGAALRTWSNNLVTLDLCGVFDGSLFWPAGQGTTVSTKSSALPSWPNLKNISVKLGTSTPTGGWYFIPRPDPESDGHRCVPNDDALQLLFASWSRALGRMPVLENAVLYFELIFEMDGAQLGAGEDSTAFGRWLVAFQAPNAIPRPGVAMQWARTLTQEESQRARLVFQCVSGWRPQRDTMERLCSISEETPVFLEVDLLDNVSAVDA
ncbi:hypothetical protein GGTG_10205 [Gaeumannomyces tritici R3-111a-1]|uniref:F-box domain-containing protein n=1 Tax=Gaeumannomyces tritici (strain R3-111a-1) TaxID=644352 RepID=J3P9M6_GAET3|nr:hypothetical protein GGTG_10205 [Gaeumannomyces tritici R3-111a-1]EJT73362.1 hypothetical protein GGTG_10205 [Gaeumannomyces tritici R3-111a-1]